MNDVFPVDSGIWRHIEKSLSDILFACGYREIRTPVVEKTELFKRSIGEVTDIVEKEMYTFDDRNGDSLTLRPEGTVSCVRAGFAKWLNQSGHSTSLVRGTHVSTRKGHKKDVIASFIRSEPRPLD